MAIDNNIIKKIGSNLNISEGQSSGFGSTQKVDTNMTMNGSIFNVGKPKANKNQFANKSVFEIMADKNKPEQVKEEAGQDTNVEADNKPASVESYKKMQTEGGSTKNKAESWGAKSKDYSGFAKSAVKSMQASVKNMSTQEKQAIKTFQVNGKEMNEVNKENDGLNTELKSLNVERETAQAEVDMLSDKTGSGKASAFSLALPVGKSNQNKDNGIDGNKKTQEPKEDVTDNSEVEEKQAVVDELDGKISSVAGTITNNTVRTTQITESNNTTKKTIDNLFKQASAQVKQQTQTATKNAEGSDTAAIVGQGATASGGLALAGGATSTGIGTAKIASGTPMLSNPVTAGAGGLLIASGTKFVGVGTALNTTGAGLTAAGGATSAFAAIAKKDTAGAVAETTKTVASLGQLYVSVNKVAAAK